MNKLLMGYFAGLSIIGTLISIDADFFFYYYDKLLIFLTK